MAGQVGGDKGGRRAEINVTPLVDVVLVLLIIFMVLSPAAISQVPNALPRPARQETSVVLTSDQLVLELRADGSAWFNNERTNLVEFQKAVVDLMARRTNRTVFFSVEDGVLYGKTVAWMAAARVGGAQTVALKISPPKTEGRGP